MHRYIKAIYVYIHIYLKKKKKKEKKIIIFFLIFEISFSRKKDRETFI